MTPADLRELLGLPLTRVRPTRGDLESILARWEAAERVANMALEHQPFDDKERQAFAEWRRLKEETR